MIKIIQERYNFDNYQIAQLKFLFLTLISEISKILIISIFFTNEYYLFLWGLFIFQNMRSSTGGIHCQGYVSCLVASLLFFLLCIKLLPNIIISKTLQLILMFVCTYFTYKTGHIVSPLHIKLSPKSIKDSKNRMTITIFCYSVLLFIMPKYRFISVGFWVIVLNTFQLLLSTFMMGGEENWEKILIKL